MKTVGGRQRMWLEVSGSNPVLRVPLDFTEDNMDRFVLENCIAWNEREARLAKRDSSDLDIKVPASAMKLAWEPNNFRTKKIPLTQDEYRLVRQRDMQRYHRNIEALRMAKGRSHD